MKYNLKPFIKVKTIPSQGKPQHAVHFFIAAKKQAKDTQFCEEHCSSYSANPNIK